MKKTTKTTNATQNLADLLSGREPVKVLFIGFIFFVSVFTILTYVLFRTQIGSRAVSDQVTLSTSTSTSGSSKVLMISGHASSAMNMRGYAFKVTFNASSTNQVTAISYQSPWAVSNGLGSDNSTLSKVNSSGSINAQGESHDSNGTPMSTSNMGIISITYTGSPTFTIDTSGKFYKIDSTSALIPVPIAVSGGTTATNTPTKSPTPKPPTATPTTSNGGPTATKTPTPKPPTATPTTGNGGPTATKTPTPKPPTATPTTGNGGPTATKTPTPKPPTATPTTGNGGPTATKTPTPKPPTATPTTGSGGPTATRTPTPVNPSPTVMVTDNPTGCSSDNDCADNESCNSSGQCTGVVCSLAQPICKQVVIANHACSLQNSPDGTTCPNGTCQSGACVSNNGSPTPVPANMNLAMKLKFQGILKSPDPRYNLFKVKVTLAGGPSGRDFLATQVVDFHAGTDGVWTGTGNFNAPAGTGYKILVKGPKHLQKRICDSNPTETYGGTYRCSDVGHITLANNSNNLDMSGILQLVGDLPDQNGIVDSYDIAYIRMNLGSTDQRVLAIADLNLDGIVDSQDYSLLIASLSIKYDEL